MVSLGLIYGFFRVHLGFHVGFLIRNSYQDFFGFHLGCLQTGENEAKEKKKEAVKTSSREAEEQSTKAEKQRSRESREAEKKRSR